MIYKGLQDIFYLFFPNVCPVCGELISERGALLCTKCMWDMPLTGYYGLVDNPVVQHFWGHLPIVNGCSLMTYTHGSPFNELIRGFKYRGNWRTARRLGELFGSYLKESGLYNDIDVVVAVPLHIRKQLKRGYNQSQYLAEGIAQTLGCAVDSRSVVRTVHNSSQTHKDKSERWENVKGIFSIKSTANLEGKHILLVDDVLTTGATIISCGECIINGIPGCRLSIATLATTNTKVRAILNDALQTPTSTEPAD